MKKKKDPSFDVLKKEVMKPLKEVVTSIRDYLTEVTNQWSDESMNSIEGLGVTDTEAFFKKITQEKEITFIMQSKRL